MSYYRVYRPQKFSDLIGQEHVTQTLSHALMTEKYSHAYLFAGPKGSGKTTTARLLAKALNCTGRKLGKDSFEPCNKCVSCREILSGSSMDILEIDAASNRGIDEIRELRDKIRFAPTAGRFKVYIIDECHMLTKEAFNALLKTLEEPPKHAIFILATTELHKVPATIISRTQAFEFKKATLAEIVKLLKKTAKQEELKIEDPALELIARMSFGAYRDALSLLEQVASLGSDKRHEIKLLEVQEALGVSTETMVWDLMDYIAARSRKKALELVEKAYYEGKSLENLTSEMVLLMQKMLLHKSGISDATQTKLENEKIAQMADLFEIERLIFAIEKMVEAAPQVKTSVLGQLPLEMAIFELTEGESSEIDMRNEKLASEQDVQRPVVLEKKVVPEEKKDEPKSDPIKAKIKIESPNHPKFPPEKWAAVVKSVKSHNNMIAAMLKDTEFQDTSDGVIVLAVKFKYQADQITAKKNLVIIEGAIFEVMGSSYKLECVVNSDLKINKPLDKEEEILNSAKEVFGTE